MQIAKQPSSDREKQSQGTGFRLWPNRSAECEAGRSDPLRKYLACLCTPYYIKYINRAVSQYRDRRFLGNSVYKLGTLRKKRTAKVRRRK